jgi:hypothetical protein
MVAHQNFEPSINELRRNPAGGIKMVQRKGLTVIWNNKFWDVVSRQAILREGGIPLVEVE